MPSNTLSKCTQTQGVKTLFGETFVWIYTPGFKFYCISVGYTTAQDRLPRNRVCPAGWHRRNVAVIFLEPAFFNELISKKLFLKNKLEVADFLYIF